MVRVTGNFTSESALHPAAKELIADFFDQGWADHNKLGDQSARTAILRNEAIESIAENLKILPSEIEIIGEPRLGLQLAVTGLLRPDLKLIHSAVDRRSIFAVGKSHVESGGQLEILPVTQNGEIDFLECNGSQAVLALQGANVETGITQEADTLIKRIAPKYVALDYSTSPTLELPELWDSAIFDASSWQGATGIGILAIRNSAQWKNPLPNLGIRRTPESASLPLLLASAVALDAWLLEEAQEKVRLRLLNERIRHALITENLAITFAGTIENSLPQKIALVAQGCVGEDLVRQLNELGFILDSGSACTAAQMQPSHVFDALGLRSEGNLRITLHHGVTENQVAELISALISVVRQSR